MRGTSRRTSDGSPSREIEAPSAPFDEHSCSTLLCFLVLLLGALAGCSQPIVGGDASNDSSVLDASSGIDVGGLDAWNDAPLAADVPQVDAPPADTSAVDASDAPLTDAARDAGALPVVVDVATAALWRVPITAGPYMSMFRSGTVAVAGGGASRAQFVDPDGTVRSPSTTIGDRSVVWVDDTGTDRFHIATYAGTAAVDPAGVRQWVYPGGCCFIRTYYAAMTVDPVNGRGYLGGGYYDLRTGALTFNGLVASDGTPIPGGAMSGTTYYGAAETRGLILRYDLAADSRVWEFPVGAGGAPPATFPPAITLADGVVLTSDGGDRAVHRRLDGTLAFEITLNTVTPPVISTDAAFFGADVGGALVITARALDDGADLWTREVEGAPTELVLGAGATVYVLLGALGILLELDQATGTERRRYLGLGQVQEILFDGNRAIAAGATHVISFDIAADGYDPDAAWPVRFHDSQRTSNRRAPLY